MSRSPGDIQRRPPDGLEPGVEWSDVRDGEALFDAFDLIAAQPALAQDAILQMVRGEDLPDEAVGRP